MAGFVDTTVKDIEERLRELKAEIGKLEAAHTALTGERNQRSQPASATRSTRSASRGTRAATQRRRPGRPRGRRSGNTRASQALELVRSEPGITIPRLAEAMKIQPNYLYRVMPSLEKDGSIKRNGQGWYPAEGTS
jgi:predicted Rossmann fold nucleotide-binding protein DprA/Smf involved in DNA uptake